MYSTQIPPLLKSTETPLSHSEDRVYTICKIQAAFRIAVLQV